MFLDLKTFFLHKDRPCAGRESLDFSAAEFPGYRVESPCGIDWKADWQGEVLQLTFTGTAVVDAECARCLKPVREEFRISRSVWVEEGKYDDPDEELPITPDGKLDLFELIYTELIVTVPSLFLCRPECQGICPVCGKERSLGCTCERDAVDDRLAILKQLLQ